MHGHQVGKREWDKLGDQDWPIYIIDAVYKTDNDWDTAQGTVLSAVWWPQGKETQKTRDTSILTGNSLDQK